MRKQRKRKKIQTTVKTTAKIKRDLSVVKFPELHDTCVMISVAKRQVVPSGGALPLWLSRASLRKLRTTIDRILAA